MMRNKLILAIVSGFCLILVAQFNIDAAESVAPPSAVDPGPNRPEEPLAHQFSVDKAVTFLDAAALTWQKQRQCFACHTNYAHLYARPANSTDDAAATEVRRFAEELITERWVKSGPRWDAEVVATAAALAFNDAATTGKLHPLTRQALDRMWTLQREDGGFTWIKCDWPPMESDDHYGATLAAIAVGAAPDGYAETEVAKNGMAKLRNYLKSNPGPTLHHRAMVLWAATLVEGLFDAGEKQAIVDQLSSLQKEDGGWGLATLGDWKRVDDEPQDLKVSDGYGTGFVLYVLRRSGVPASDARIQRGIQWLKANQRESGRWFTRSLHKDSKHYITHAGTAFAIMALRESELK
jgi:squalene-hopene/tetraprenyl-beta-curcumene cyclase